MIRTGSAAAVCLVVTCLLHIGTAWAQSPADAVSLEQRGDWSGAEVIWRSLVRANPGDYRYWTSLGACLAHEKRFAEAIAHYKHALAISPHDPQTNFNLGLAYFKLGKLDQAIPPLKAAAMTLRTPQLDLVLGMSLYGSGRYAAASPYLQAAQTRDPDNGELQLVLARTYLLSGTFEKAQEQFRLMLARNPDSPEVHLLLGEAYDGLGKQPQAQQEFQAAAKGKVPGAHFALGYLLWRDKHYKEATIEFRRELALFPDQYTALAYLGDSLFKQGETQDAVKWIRRSIALKDVLWVTHYDLGTIAQEQKNYQEAIRQLRHSIRLDSKRPEAHYRLAQAYRAMGNNAAAVAELRIVKRLHATQNKDLIVKVEGPPASRAGNTPPH